MTLKETVAGEAFHNSTINCNTVVLFLALHFIIVVQDSILNQGNGI